MQTERSATDRAETTRRLEGHGPDPRELAPVEYDAVVVLQMGGPASTQGIEPFLRNLFSDPDIIRLPALMRPFQPRLAARIAKRRASKVAPRYEDIGGSPIGAITQAQADGLARRLGIPVHVAMRYCPPTADDAVAKLKAAGARRVLVLSLYPHYSRSTTGSSLRDLARAAEGWDGEFDVIDRWGDHAAYVDVLAATCREAGGEHLLLSAHSLPQKYVDEGDPYPAEVAQTVRLLRERVPFQTVHQGYQSAVGPVKWIGPETEEHLEALASAGATTVTLAPLGFVSDHIETLYDLDRKYRPHAESLGMRVHRVASLNDRSDFLDALATICRGTSRPLGVQTWTR